MMMYQIPADLKIFERYPELNVVPLFEALDDIEMCFVIILADFGSPARFMLEEKGQHFTIMQVCRVLGVLSEDGEFHMGYKKFMDYDNSDKLRRAISFYEKMNGFDHLKHLENQQKILENIPHLIIEIQRSKNPDDRKLYKELMQELRTQIKEDTASKLSEQYMMARSVTGSKRLRDTMPELFAEYDGKNLLTSGTKAVGSGKTKELPEGEELEQKEVVEGEWED